MTLSSNPNGITNLPDTRDRAPTLAAAATAVKFKQSREKLNYVAVATAADSLDDLLRRRRTA